MPSCGAPDTRYSRREWLRAAARGVAAAAVAGAAGDWPLGVGADSAQDPVAPWPPSFDERRVWRAAIALDPETFVPFCLSWDGSRWRGFLDRYSAAGLTHVYVQLRGRYRGQGDFDLRRSLPLVHERLDELAERRLVPILWASAGEWHGNDARAILADWERMLGERPALGGLLPVVVPGPEFDDYLDPRNQHALITGLARLFPDAYRVAHFSPGRTHGGAPRHSHHPVGSLPEAWGDGSLQAFWSAYRERRELHALAYNMPRDERDNVFAMDGPARARQRDARADMLERGDRHKAIYSLKQAVRRLSRTVPGYEDAASYPPVGGFDCVLGEFGAHDVLRGRRAWDDGAELRRAALLVPGVTGFGD